MHSKMAFHAWFICQFYYPKTRLFAAFQTSLNILQLLNSVVRFCPSMAWCTVSKTGVGLGKRLCSMQSALHAHAH